MKKLAYLLFLAPLLLNLNCKKDEVYHQMDDRFKDYVSFPIGKYWVYKDSVTGVVSDSIVLVEQKIEKVRTDFAEYNTPGVYEDRVTQRFSRYCFRNDSIYWFTGSTLFGETFFNMTYDQWDYEHDVEYVPFAAFGVFTEEYNRVNNMYIINSLGDTLIEDVLYQDVYKIRKSDQLQDSEFIADSWLFARYYGVIKFKSRGKTYILTHTDLID